MLLKKIFDFKLLLTAKLIFNVKPTTAIETNQFPIIEIQGNKFFNSANNEQFFLKGIAYQPSIDTQGDKSLMTYIDPLADPEICLRDIPHLKKLGINTIRVYSIDPTRSHDICMNELARANIYVLLDLSEPDISINRDDPSWTVPIWKRYKGVVDAMHKYPNILGFFAGNEVTNDKSNTNASPFVKAAIRDTKNYLKKKNYRQIPVGYATNDDVDTRDNLAKYFICGETKADFYGVNMYEWCGYSSFEISGYKERTTEFANYPIPVFFSEFGCNLVRPRPFTEVRALFGAKMSRVWSGGLVYMYFEEENKYGVVEIDKQSGKVIELEDFQTLKKAFDMAKPKSSKFETSIEWRTVNKPLSKERKLNCPSISYCWKANGKLPGTPEEEKCECLNQVLPCLVEPFEDPLKYKQYFDYVCSKVDCTDILADGERGVYGNYSDCSDTQKLSLLLSKFYFKSDGKTTKCPIEDPNIYFNLDYNKALSLYGSCHSIESRLQESNQMTFMNGSNINGRIVPTSRNGMIKNNSGTYLVSNFGTASFFLFILFTCLFFH